MCELLGLAMQRPISASFSIREFADRDHQNPDGWGLAWYPDRSGALIKEPVSWRASKHTEFLQKYPAMRSSIYIAHIRHKTVGGPPNHADTHPFLREYAGRDYFFAHNGTLKGLEVSFFVDRYCPVGETDSEFAFCHLLAAIARRNSHLTTDEDYWQLHDELTKLNGRGQLNCLMADGRSLFCYHDLNGYKGLAWRKVDLPGDRPGQLEDGEMQLAIESATANDGYVVATYPLGGAGWRSFHPGELMVIRDGLLQYSSHAGQSSIAASDLAAKP